MNQPASNPIPGHQGPPNSTTPIRDLFGQNRRGVSTDGAYVVLPAAALESMPLHWQQRFASALAELQRETQEHTWPLYQVVPSTTAPVAELSESKLREVGALHVLNDDGQMVHQWRSGEPIPNPEQHHVLVSCPDPLQQPQPQHRGTGSGDGEHPWN